jgi:hypothetical protein
MRSEEANPDILATRGRKPRAKQLEEMAYRIKTHRELNSAILA